MTRSNPNLRANKTPIPSPSEPCPKAGLRKRKMWGEGGEERRGEAASAPTVWIGVQRRAGTCLAAAAVAGCRPVAAVRASCSGPDQGSAPRKQSKLCMLVLVCSRCVQGQHEAELAIDTIIEHRYHWSGVAHWQGCDTCQRGSRAGRVSRALAAGSASSASHERTVAACKFKQGVDDRYINDAMMV